jgi:hypothetical protein
MNALKNRNMMATYAGFAGPVTLRAVKNQVPEALWSRLTGAELGLVLTAINAAYHSGRASTGAEMIDEDFLWVNALDRGFEIDQLRAIS